MIFPPQRFVAYTGPLPLCPPLFSDPHRKSSMIVSVATVLASHPPRMIGFVFDYESPPFWLRMSSVGLLSCCLMIPIIPKRKNRNPDRLTFNRTNWSKFAFFNRFVILSLCLFKHWGFHLRWAGLPEPRVDPKPELLTACQWSAGFTPLVQIVVDPRLVQMQLWNFLSL